VLRVHVCSCGKKTKKGVLFEGDAPLAGPACDINPKPYDIGPRGRCSAIHVVIHVHVHGIELK
jgi:hypothetical protein